jgi:hypothetical protein
MQRHLLIVEHLGPARFSAPEVAAAALHAHYFAGAGDMETTLGGFMSL